MYNSIDVSVLLISYNTAHLLSQCLDALLQSLHKVTSEIIIVDNSSTDASVDLVKSHYPQCQLVENQTNVGFGRANNQALKIATGRYVLLLNTDAFVSPDTVVKTIRYMDNHADYGILGVKLVGCDGTPQPSARSFPTPWTLFVERTGLRRLFRDVSGSKHSAKAVDGVRDCDWVPGCYYLIRREVIDQVGLFDPRYFLYYEEVDHCFTTKKAGWKVAFYPDTTVVHLGGESAKSEGEITKSGKQIPELQIESELLYFRKNYGFTGVCVDVALTSLAIAINSLKNLVKIRSLGDYSAYLRQIMRFYLLFYRTKFGTRSTR